MVKRIGNKNEVWNGEARQTSGGLKKADLIKNPRGKIVSRKMSEAAKRRYPALVKAMCDKRAAAHPPAAPVEEQKEPVRNQFDLTEDQMAKIRDYARVVTGGDKNRLRKLAHKIFRSIRQQMDHFGASENEFDTYLQRYTE